MENTRSLVVDHFYERYRSIIPEAQAGSCRHFQDKSNVKSTVYAPFLPTLIRETDKIRTPRIKYMSQTPDTTISLNK